MKVITALVILCVVTNAEHRSGGKKGDDQAEPTFAPALSNPEEESYLPSSIPSDVPSTYPRSMFPSLSLMPSVPLAKGGKKSSGDGGKKRSNDGDDEGEESTRSKKIFGKTKAKKDKGNDTKDDKVVKQKAKKRGRN